VVEMATVKVNIEAVEVQLRNAQVTTPAIIRIFQDHIDLRIITPDGQLGIEAALVDNKIRLVLRNHTMNDPIEPYVMTLYDFFKS
jgi:hypothetical protein